MFFNKRHVTKSIADLSAHNKKKPHIPEDCAVRYPHIFSEDKEVILAAEHWHFVVMCHAACVRLFSQIYT